MNDLSINFIVKQDKPFLLKYSQLPSEDFDRKYKYEEILIAKVASKTVGLLVFDYLWYDTPFIEFIWVDDKYRKSDIGFRSS